MKVINCTTLLLILILSACDITSTNEISSHVYKLSEIDGPSIEEIKKNRAIYDYPLEFHLDGPCSEFNGKNQFEIVGKK